MTQHTTLLQKTVIHACTATLITARKRSLGQGNIFRGMCQEFCPRGVVVSQHALQVGSKHALQVSGGEWCPSMPCRSPGPHPREKLRGLARWWGGALGPHPWAQVEGSGLGGLQAHSRGVSPGPHLGGSPGPHLGGLSQHALRQTPPQQMATAAGGTHPTGMHSC